MLQLVRATCHNGIFRQVSDQWRAPNLIEYNDVLEPEDYFPTMMEHAAKIAEEVPPDRKYGIFCLVGTQADGTPSYEGIVHVNHKLPNTSAATLRMVWNLLAPKYDYEGAEALARITASYVLGGIQLCRADMRSSALQMYLTQMVLDRLYASGAVSFL